MHSPHHQNRPNLGNEGRSCLCGSPKQCDYWVCPAVLYNIPNLSLKNRAMIADPPIFIPSTSSKGSVPQGVSAEQKESSTARRRSLSCIEPSFTVQMCAAVRQLTRFHLLPLLTAILQPHILVLHASLSKHEATHLRRTTSGKVVQLVGRHGSLRERRKTATLVYAMVQFTCCHLSVAFYQPCVTILNLTPSLAGAAPSSIVQ